MHVEKKPKISKRIESSYNPIVPAVEQASRILLCLGESSNPRIGLTEICKELGIHKSKVFTILHTLQQFGFVEKDPQTKMYSLGFGLLLLSRFLLDDLHCVEVASPFIQQLAKETGETVVFGLINGDYLSLVLKSEGNPILGLTLRLGSQFHISHGAHGKAIAAFMSEANREKLLAKNKLYFYGNPSRLDKKRLGNEIIKCRKLGYAKDIGELMPGVHVVSSPVFNLQKTIIGCIILLGTFPERKVEEYGREVTHIAKKISQKLGAEIETIYPN